MPFIRVRHASGPAHEFDIPIAAYEREKSLYKVVDKHPVAVSRPVTYKKASSQNQQAKPAEKKEK